MCFEPRGRQQGCAYLPGCGLGCRRPDKRLRGWVWSPRGALTVPYVFLRYLTVPDGPLWYLRCRAAFYGAQKGAGLPISQSRYSPDDRPRWDCRWDCDTDPDGTAMTAPMGLRYSPDGTAITAPMGLRYSSDGIAIHRPKSKWLKWHSAGLGCSCT